MTLRTPRRRISPRTKRKYRAIKNFLRRALGTSSQRGTKTSSSIEVSVSNLKSKIIDIEQQLNSVSQHCQDVTCLENNFREESENSLVQLQQVEGEDIRNTGNSDTNDVETKLLYKSSSSQHRRPDRNNTLCTDEHDETKDMESANRSVAQNSRDFQFKQENMEFQKKKREKNDFDLVDRRRTHLKTITTNPIYSTSSFHSLIDSGNKHCSQPGYDSHRHEKRHPRKEHTEPLIVKEHENRERTHERELIDDRHNKRRTKRVYSEVDKDFIADIIKRQYRPVKLFGRRDSGFSQFSAPVCRDQEFMVCDDIQRGVELCSCCFDKCRKTKHRHGRYTDLSDMKSICDTRLYSKRNRRHKLERNNTDDYNNSALYDVVPVREKSSPKARRKFKEDNIFAYQCCREVPPSPRSNRPKLNLKVQHYANYEDSLYRERPSLRISPTRDGRKKVLNGIESDVSSEYYLRRTKAENLNKSRKPDPIHEDVGTMSSLQYTNFANEQYVPNNDTTLNTQLTDATAHKTDKTLCEIKDILKTFLLEIKKETTYSDRSCGTSKVDNKQMTLHQENTQTNSNTIPISGDSFNTYNIRQAGMQPFMPAFPNPCCYPIVPICPVNCLQNGYVIPSPSYTCNLCAKTSKDHECPDHKSKPPEELNTNNETQELIKEIYKFVLQKPKTPRTEECGNINNSARSKNEYLFENKILHNRYVGGCTKASKHDANVGTHLLKCYSKSCEAFGSKIASDTYNTNASYSDTILEKLSFKATQSSIETDLSTDVPEEKVRRGKLSKLFNTLRLFKKKKRDVIEEMNESESIAGVEEKRSPPFKQHIQCYAMHGQDYFHPPVPEQHCCYSPCHECFGNDYDPRTNYPQPPHDFYNNHKYRYDHPSAPQYSQKYPTAPPYPNYDPFYNQIPPQVPLCLKEIEVKNVGTQSERTALMQKIVKKTTAQQQQEASRYTTPGKEKTNFWKSLQEKAYQNQNDTMNFSLKTQKDLAQGDMNLKNVMMKKLFYKKNPFSPRNLIMRTLLGKDKSSYGNPPKIFRPRMFL
ncbi:uncharacterized protein LOC120624534 [Pararge aegeria]|uniref:uncharacterized protein LOC120624534 n=1 Tax=Pararge aegeria TaxID=116150 RepID=UPI0019D26245|nr:uncharacterized protein LOC120624534 [Pararge aegeria]